MTDWAASLSDWALALLPRLFIYPGAVWMLAMLGVLRFAGGGRKALGADTLLDELSRGSLAPLAAAWAVLALVPLPEARLMPFPLDRFSLCALLALSLVLSRALDRTVDRIEDITGVAVTLALLIPVIGERTLLTSGVSPSLGLAGWLSILAVGVGLTALLPAAAHSLSGGVRWLAWLGLTILDFGFWISDFGWIGASLLYVGAIVVAVVVGRGAQAYFTEGRAVRYLAVTAWGLAALSLLVALPA